MLTQNEAMGGATASDGGLAPIASFWVKIEMSCTNIQRGVFQGSPILYISVSPEIFPGNSLKLFLKITKSTNQTY